MDYSTMTDEELIDIYKSNQSDSSVALDILINRYTPLINIKASKIFIIGAERKDIIQEGMIALFSALKNYDRTKAETSFKTFANLCIQRRLITLIKTSNRQKQIPLNNAISYNAKKNNTDEYNRSELIEFIDDGYNPYEELENKEYYNRMIDNLCNKLSKHEKKVFNEYLKGKSYAEIASSLNCAEKSVDTALTRIRRKGSNIMKKYDNNKY